MAILILAAGEASRMGEPKQLLPWKNSTLLENAIKTAKTCPADVFVVVGVKGEVIKQKIKEEVMFIDNKNWEMGLGASIASGVQHLMQSGTIYGSCAILLADQPLIDAAHMSDMITAHTQNNKGITATTYINGVGVPVIFDSTYFEALSQLHGDNGAKKILETYKKDVQSVDPKGKTLDIDTKEAYKNLLKYY